MPKSICVNEPYPTTEGISEDGLSLSIISPAYASSHSELNTVLQYVYHSFFFNSKGYDEISDKLLGIAICEMHHLEMLGRTILALGAAPVYAQFPSTCFNFYSSKFVAYSRTLKNMLEDDLVGERYAVKSYEKMLKRLCNRQVSAIISRIIADEKLHIEVLEEILSGFKG